MSCNGGLRLVHQASLEAKRQTRKRQIIIGVSAIALVAIIIVIAVAVKNKSDEVGKHSASSYMSASVKAVCQTATYPNSCYSTLSPQVDDGKPMDAQKLFENSLTLAKAEVSHALSLFEQLKASGRLDGFVAAAADSCTELLGMSLVFLNQTSESTGWLASAALAEDRRTWLSASLTYLDTCLDGFQNAPAPLLAEVSGYLRNSTESTSNSLSVLSFFANIAASAKVNRRGLLSEDGFPPWMSIGNRKLLQDDADAIRENADIVVAQDGSSEYHTINAALKAVPDRSIQRTIIYVKKGVYNEYVTVEKSKWNVTIVGDGKEVTTITGLLSVKGNNITTFKTATFATFGERFIAIDIGFQNTAGAENQQAVALLSSSDHSVFYRCKMDAFQDTLYCHSMRQFYRECDIYGTMDFIFGNALMVLQNCNIYAREREEGQHDVITAQGKTDPKTNTGISIHQCTVNPLSNVPVYLGRPWKNYSTTIFMKTFLPSVIEPAGWIPMRDTPLTNISYGEYLNTGPGASTANRVEWMGLGDLNATTAADFTVGHFLNGGSWLPQTKIPFVAEL